ncbi:hypothetical protein [Pantoea ananatis]|uniref:hypothetical protein n=1 Tax=Pantoea ananas TaxID=553 RepID=UPI0007DAD5CA|nr:hypothetical protein [Pantoea ananatis]
MEKSALPQWLVDASTIMGLIGFIITIIGFFLTYIIFNQTKEIKLKFISKARLPQLSEDLSTHASLIIKILQKKDVSLEMVSVEFSKCAGLLENILTKVKGPEGTAAKSLLGRLKYRKWPIGRYKYIQVTDSQEAWELYTELSGFTTKLTQLIKDSHWDTL